MLKDLASSHNLTAIMNTHHHWDHAGGNKKILDKLSSPVPIIGGKDCEGVSRTPADREKVRDSRTVPEESQWKKD